MTRTGNANWNAQIAASGQAPVYFIRIDGLSKDYATAEVQNAGTSKTVLMDIPTGGASTIDLVSGAYTVQETKVALVDVDDEITELVCTTASGAPLSTLVNRKATIYGGFRPLDESDYLVMFIGRIRGVRMRNDLNAFEFTISSINYLLNAEIMNVALPTHPTTIRGNIVNIYASILRGVFSESDPDFPLDYVSENTVTSTKPYGLDIPDALIDFAKIKDSRDMWHPDDVANVVFTEPVNAQNYLTSELFRIFQSFPAISGDGTIGLKFHVPALPPSSAVEITSDHIVEIVSWQQMFKDHLNKFTIVGDYAAELSQEYESVLYETEDTTDQAATEETIEYYAESKWLHTDYDGVSIAWELAERMKQRFVVPPIKIELSVLPTRLNLEQGDVVKVTDADLPDMATGTRGVDEHMMTILAIRPDWETGLLRLTLLDTGGKRYGLIAENSQVDYTSATTADKETYFFISDNSGLMSDASDGYRFI